MDEYESLSHTKWECKYYVVFLPKCRRKALYVELRKRLGEGFGHLAQQKESGIEEGHLMSDHVHIADRHTAEISGVAGGRVYQRQKRDPSGAGVRGAEGEFCRAALLGARVFSIHGGTR